MFEKKKQPNTPSFTLHLSLPYFLPSLPTKPKKSKKNPTP
jgi:hypothetical protein